MNKLRKILVTGLGTGYLPLAPGTWGSAAICAIFLAVAFGSGGRAVCVTGTMIVLALAATAGCVALGGGAEQTFGKKDPSHCTLDEWAGQAVTFILLPLGADWRGYLLAAAVGFTAFRFFDIIKPPPARYLERLPRGWGLVADDLAAAIYANALCQLLLRLWLLKLL
ncbi:MAG: phosphatidylglycerophosphatase A [Phycisphaerae bacterium]|nr:phosphatidylglycerophosphatase A [Phycisphaerae bacterium]